MASSDLYILFIYFYVWLSKNGYAECFNLPEREKE
jgi:hypothetical protein